MNRKQTLNVDGNMATVSGHCVLSGKPYKTASFPVEAYNRWQSGDYIQDALHMLSLDDREFLISGLSPEAFDACTIDPDIDDDIEYL